MEKDDKYDSSNDTKKNAAQVEYNKLVEAEHANRDWSHRALEDDTKTLVRQISILKSRNDISKQAVDLATSNLQRSNLSVANLSQELIAHKQLTRSKNALGTLDSASLRAAYQKTKDLADRLETEQILQMYREDELKNAKELKQLARNDLLKSTLDLVKMGVFATVDGGQEMLGIFKSLASGPLGAMVQLLKLAVDRFVELDKAAETFRRSTGLTIKQTVELRKNAELLNSKYQDMGVSIGEAYKAAEALVGSFGGLALASERSSETVALLSANLGVAAENTADVLVMFKGLGGMTDEMANKMVKVGAAMTAGTIVPFSKVMEDISKSSDDVQFLLGNNPKTLLKTAIAARSLGTNLNSLAATSKKLLNFQSSINDEMEASALIGVSLNFQRARQLAFDGEIADAAKESLKVVKQAGDWNTMNVFQREALAKASGMELKDLNKMVALDKIRSSNTAEGEKLRMLDVQLKTLDNINKSKEDALVTEAEEEIKQRQIQGVMTNIGNMMKSVFIELADILTPVVKVLVSAIVPTLKLIGLLVKLVGVLLSPIGELFESMDAHGINITKWLDSGTGLLDKWQKNMSGMWGATTGITKSLVITAKILIGILGTYLSILAAQKTMAVLGKTKSLLAVGTNILSKGISGASGGVLNGMSNIGIGSLKKTTSGLGSGLGKAVQSFLISIAKGIKAFGNPKVLLGAAVMVILAASFWILGKALKGLAEISWETLGKAAATIVGIAVVAGILGIPVIAAAVATGAVVLILLGTSLIVFAAAAWIGGKASQELAKGLDMAIEPLSNLADIGAVKLLGAAAGIYAVSAALASFGAGAAMSGIGSLVGKIAGGDPIEKLKLLAGLSDDLSSTASSIQSITSAFSRFTVIDKFSDSISKLAESMDKLNTSVSSISALNMAKLTAASILSPRETSVIPTTTQTSTVSTTQTSPTQTSSDDVVIAIKELTTLLKNGAISVNIDGRKMSSALAAHT